MLIAAGRISGHGNDCDGAFSYTGVYGDDNSVTLTKIYTAPIIYVPASMTYRGVWNGHYVAGIWHDDRDPSNRGPFELWPKDEEMEIEAIVEVAEVAEELVVHGEAKPGSPMK